MENLTEAQAKKLFKSGWWKELTLRERATFQLYENRLCMPFDVFHEAIEKTLGRPVWTHEFGLNRQGLMDELAGNKPPPTMEEIINLIPEEKRIIIT